MVWCLIKTVQAEVHRSAKCLSSARKYARHNAVVNQVSPQPSQDILYSMGRDTLHNDETETHNTRGGGDLASDALG